MAQAHHNRWDHQSQSDHYAQHSEQGLADKKAQECNEDQDHADNGRDSEQEAFAAPRPHPGSITGEFTGVLFNFCPDGVEVWG